MADDLSVPNSVAPEKRGEPQAAPLTVALPTPVARHKYTQAKLRVVVFKVAGQEYVVEVSQVQEIIRLPTLKPMPGAPKLVEGVVKRRGRIVPVVDLRKLLHTPVTPPTSETCVVIARLGFGPVGLIVDAALELVWVKTKDFEVPSPLLAGADRPYVQGVAYVGERVWMMLDVELLLALSEHQALGAWAAEANPG